MQNKKELLKGLAGGRVENRGQLEKETFRVKGDQSMTDATEPTTRVRKTGTENIDTKGIGKMTSGQDFAKTQADRSLKGDLRATARAAAEVGDTDTLRKLKKIAQKMAKGARTGMKALPLIGGVAAAIGSEDASAAVPILGDAEAAGMSAQAEDQFMAEREAQKDYGQSQAAQDRRRALARLAKLQE